MFYNATSANPDTSGWDTSSVTNMEVCSTAPPSANPDTSGWDTSAVTDMSWDVQSPPQPTRIPVVGIRLQSPDMEGCSRTPPRLTPIPVAGIRQQVRRYVWSMFDGASSANPDTSGWDTSSVIDMRDMFNDATSANPDTSGWDTSSVTRNDGNVSRRHLSQPGYQWLGYVIGHQYA